MTRKDYFLLFVRLNALEKANKMQQQSDFLFVLRHLNCSLRNVAEK